MKPRKRGVMTVVVVLAVLSLFSVSASAAQGCFTKPDYVASHTGGCQFIQEGQARVACSNNGRATTAEINVCMREYFIDSVTSCATVSICAFTPNTYCGATGDTCQDVDYAAQCENRDLWIPPPTDGTPSEEPARCTIGCCVCNTGTGGQCPLDSTTNAVLLKNTEGCIEFCAEQYNTGVRRFEEGLTVAQCTPMCQTTTTTLIGRITGFVKDTDNAPIAGATVTAWTESVVTGPDGWYKLDDLPLGNTIVTATRPGYRLNTVTKVLTQSSSATAHNFVLQFDATGVIEGDILDASGNAIPTARVTIGTRTVSVDNTGHYVIGGLAYGAHTVFARADNFAEQSKSASVAAVNPIVPVDFTLVAVEQATIRVAVVNEGTINPVSFAEVIVNGEFEMYAALDGTAEFTVATASSGTDYVITITHSDYESSTETITVLTGDTEDVMFELIPLMADCPSPVAKSVGQFEAHHIAGEEAVRLTWERPCREVSGYKISRIKDGDTTEIAYMDVVIGHNVDPKEFVDDGVEWSTDDTVNTYTYSIIAVYAEQGLRESSPETFSITMGDARCEAQFEPVSTANGELHPIEFCINNDHAVGRVNDGGSTWRRQCNEENALVDAASGGSSECEDFGGTFYCSTTDGGTDTLCRDAGQCSSQVLQANPFGLWFTNTGTNSCYGPLNQIIGLWDNFCSYEKAYTGTIFQECISCTEITSCFQYNSEDSCTRNNCRAGGGNDCSWVSTSDELGTGFCTQDNYVGNDKCGECGQYGQIFSATECDAQICSTLGQCFADDDSNSCVGCLTGDKAGATTCDSIETEIECVGDGSNPIRSGGIFTGSDNICGLASCAWDDQIGCFKDGNADREDDCEDRGSGAVCHTDFEAPVTTISPHIIRVGSYDDAVTFSATRTPDAPLYVHFCVGRDQCLDFDDARRANYERQPDGTYTADVDFRTLGLERTNGQTVYASSTRDYFIGFFSVDQSQNTEDIQYKTFVADLDKPDITIEDEIKLGTDSTIKFTVIVKEPVTCVDELKRIDGNNAEDSLFPDTLGRIFIVEYDVEDGVYQYNVRCTDEFGNQETATKSGLHVDNDDFITILAPPRVTDETELRFEVEVSDPSTCTLIDVDSTTRERLDRLQGATHVYASSRYQFNSNIFYANWKVECVEEGQFCTGTAAQCVHTEYFLFAIDKESPRTTVHLKSDDGGEVKLDNSGWVEEFISPVDVTFECNDLPSIGGEALGYGCRETLYCVVNDDAESTSTGADPGCTPTETSTPLDVDDDTTICYFSIDENGNGGARECGTIHIDDSFDIEIISPEFGVSDNEEFDLEITTRIAAESCKWTGVVPRGGVVSYGSIAAARNQFIQTNSHAFKIEKFNEKLGLDDSDNGKLKEIMIMCKATLGDNIISPAQRFLVGYDTTKPGIMSAEAEPALVSEGNTVEFLVETDEPTLCKYGTGTNYADLTGEFDGFEDDIFALSHHVELDITSEHDGQDHTFDIGCVNLAGITSDTEQVTFRVDFSIAGAITSTEPQGASQNPAELVVETSQNSFCEYAVDGEEPLTYTYFDSDLVKEHRIPLTNLAEGEYSYRIRCAFPGSGVIRYSIISFTVDKTAPTIHSVDDGEISCDLDDAGFEVNATENTSQIVRYGYELFEKGSSHAIAYGNVTSSETEIDVELNDSVEYFFKVVAEDAAGNIASAKTSDGFIAYDPDNVACEEDDPPHLLILQNVTRHGVSVTFQCRDSSGCREKMYGTAETRNDCNATRAYSLPILVSEDTWFCVAAEDSTGNKARRVSEVDVPDRDGDGITDSFDNCKTTKAGATVDNNGCAESEVLIDTDSDGLDDDWEFRYHAVDCLLNPRERDSDGNGVDDGDEDYDNDGVLNKDELLARTHPCVTSQSDTGTDTQTDSTEDTDTDPAVSQEETSIFSLILLIIGLFLILIGVVYLFVVPMIKKKPVPDQIFDSLPEKAEPPPVSENPELHKLRKNIAHQRRAHKAHELQKKRRVFEAFGDEEPHSLFLSLDKKIKKEKEPADKLYAVKKMYQRHKPVVDKTLNPKEKSIFSRLEKLAKNVPKKAQNSALEDLQKIIKKHKRKGK